MLLLLCLLGAASSCPAPSAAPAPPWLPPPQGSFVTCTNPKEASCPRTATLRTRAGSMPQEEEEEEEETAEEKEELLVWQRNNRSQKEASG